MTPLQKEAVIYLFKDGYFARKTINASGNDKYKVYDEAVKPLKLFPLSTFEKHPVKDVLKKNKGKITLNLSKVRQLRNNSFIKRLYILQNGNK